MTAEFQPQTPPRIAGPHNKAFTPITARKDRELPWQVETALSRLRQDLQTLPLYSRATPEEIRRIKLQVINDVIRPIRTPELLKDFLINCDLVAAETAVLEETQVEREIVGDLSEEMLIATAWELIKDLEQLGTIQGKTSVEGPSKQINRRLIILREVVGRLCGIGSAIKQDLLASLLKHQVLSVENLPPEIKRTVETLRLADTFLVRKDEYIESLGRIRQDESGRELATMVYQILPELLRRSEYQAVAKIVQAVNEGRRTTQLLEELAGSLSQAMATEDIIRQLLKDMDSQDKERRNHLVEIVVSIGDQAGPGLLEAYAKSQTKTARMSIFEAMRRIGGNLLQRFLARLPDIEPDWFVVFHILETLSDHGDASLAQPISRFLHHARVHVRQAALTALFKLQGANTEHYFLQALQDGEGVVRKMAIAYLERIKSRHPQALEFYFKVLRGDDASVPPENDAVLIEVCHALAGFQGLSADDIGKAETILLAALRPAEQKGVLSWFKKPSPQYSEQLRTAIGEALAAIRKSAAVGPLHHVADRERAAAV